MCFSQYMSLHPDELLNSREKKTHIKSLVESLKPSLDTTLFGTKFGICCFSAKHAALNKEKGKDWLAQNQDNASKWGDMSIRGLLFQ